MTTLHLIVGLPWSGKTTLAKLLETQHQAILLSPDEWQIRLFSQDFDHPNHNWRHDSIEDMLREWIPLMDPPNEEELSWS